MAHREATEQSLRWPRGLARTARVGRGLCLGGAALGALGLLGSATGVSLLTTFVPGQPPMMPNTALALLVVGAAGALRHREPIGRVGRTLAVLGALFVLGLGLATIAEYLYDLDLPVDRLLRPDPVGPYPGRPSPWTALALTFLAGAVLLFESRPTARARPSEWLALAAGFTAFTAQLGQLFGAGPLYRLTAAPVMGVAVPTALGLLLIAVGLLLEWPRGGIVGVVTAPTPGGALLRRLIPPAILAPAVLGLIVARLLSVLGGQNAELLMAALAASTTVSALVLLALTALPLNRAQEALEATRARTEALIEQGADGIFVADLDGRYTDVNSAGCRMLGFSREELVGKTISDLIRPEDGGRLAQSKEQMLEGRVHVAEWTLRRKDGTFLPVEVSAKILRDGRWQGFVRDISDRRRAELALQLAEARSSGILSISADAIISVDEDSRITMFNAGAEKIFGYSRTEVIGAPLDLLIPERFRAIHPQHVKRFAAGQQIAGAMGKLGADIAGLRKDGTEFRADAAISKLDVGGKRVLTVALRDVTEQKQIAAEQRFLAEAGAVLASTIEYEDTLTAVARLAAQHLADLCVIEITRGDGEYQRRLVASKDPSAASVCRVLMETPLAQRRAHPLWPDPDTDRPVLMQALPPQMVASLAQNDEQLRALREVAPQSVIAAPLTARGEPLGVMLLVSSTPSRVHAPAELRLVDEFARRAALSIENGRLYEVAQRAVQAREDVLGVVAHDLRNPLAVIVMQAGTLRRRGREPERRSQKAVDVIERAATRLNRLIDDLLDVTRLEAGHLPVAPERVPAGEVLQTSVEAQQPIAMGEAVALQCDVAADLPEVLADRDRLLQAFENLIGNAIKFSKPGGRVAVGGEAREGEVLFWVADAGVGISAEDLPHVFDRFWQASRAGRSGAGLGLSIVKGIVEAHGGRIWVESTPRQGSTFFFTIPTAVRAEAGLREPTPPGG